MQATRVARATGPLSGTDEIRSVLGWQAIAAQRNGNARAKAVLTLAFEMLEASE